MVERGRWAAELEAMSWPDSPKCTNHNIVAFIFHLGIKSSYQTTNNLHFVYTALHDHVILLQRLVCEFF